MDATPLAYSRGERYEKLCRDFKEAQRLSEDESKLDPEDEPYRSKYKARAILEDIRKRLDSELEPSPGSKENFTDDGPRTGQWQNLVCLASARLGVNFVECEENSSGEEHLMKALRIAQDRHLELETANLEQFILNQLGILWASRRKNEKSLEYLKKSELLYHEYLQKQSLAPYSPDDLLCEEATVYEGQEKARMDNFESTYTHTLYYLAQAHGNAGDAATSARYCHATLHRQLNTRHYAAVDWSLSAATLSQYYHSVGEFPLSRHCLAAADYIFTCEAVAMAPASATSCDEDGLANKMADIKRCWIKYALALLEASKARLLADTEVAGAAAGRWTKAKEDSEDERKHKDLKFDLELTSFEEVITDQPVLDFEQARRVFLQVQKWISEASQFYIFDGYCTDHIQLVQDHSRCYILLTFFEGDPERQCRMHKRRVDVLSVVADEVSQQHYLLVWRQLVYELAEAYSAMVDAKMAVADATPPTSPDDARHAAKKLNQLARCAIGRYHEYIESLREGPPGTAVPTALPLRFGNGDERPALVAWFCTARLYARLLDGGDVTQRLENTKASYDHYRLVVDYCERNVDAAQVVLSELSLCREMTELLPAKMDKLRSSRAS